jgi:LacI family transcriptional regulator
MFCMARRDGSNQVRMLDVAREAGVSRATVSLVMRGDPVTAPHTREIVLAAAEKLGYVYDRRAAQLRSGQSNVVALIATDIRNPFFAEFAEAVEAPLKDHDKVMLVAFTHDDVEAQRMILRRLVEDRVTDIILVPAIGTSAQEIRELSAGADVVLATRRLTGADVAYVGTDDELGAAQVAEHLLGHGCRTVAFFGGKAASPTRQLRARSFADAVRSGQATLVPSWHVPSEPSAVEGFRLAAQLIQQGPVPEGIACNSDPLAFGVLRALADAGIAIGREVRVTGFDDLAYSALWRPSLSSVRVEPAILGQLAVTAVLGGEVRTYSHPPTLIARESCGCVSAATS